MSDIIKTQRSLATKAMHQPAHRFDHLYRVICQQEWIGTALRGVLANKGARTPGVDGVTKEDLSSEKAKQALVQAIEQELRERSFRPAPVRRVSIPKGNGKYRPLGISTLKDRVVQMLLKMVLEPIWENDFLNCSNGFRPGRRTMDCIALLDSYINERSKYFWVIEGDIRAAFDSIHQATLLTLLARRVADQRLLGLIERCLKAGLMQGKLFHRTDIGTPQGAICSPLLSNVYLHQLDLYWWHHYGGLHRKAKERRRQAHQGNCALIRYADDWLLLTNGSKQEAYRLRDEFQTFLAEELKLELAVEKTHVTHVNDGFDFLGFHVQRYVSDHDRPKMLVMPSNKAQQRLKAKIKEMTARQRFRDAPLLKFSALNAILRGWITYYRHSNAKAIAKDLDFWGNRRLFRWLQRRHKATAHRIMTMYKHREHGTRSNLGIQNGEERLFLYRMSDQPLTKYRSRNPQNPYLAGDWVTQQEQSETPLPHYVWLGNAENNAVWREIKAQVKAERGAKCACCSCPVNLDLHHRKAKRYGGKDTPDNAELLCRPCHVHTPTFGDHSRLQ
jgi:group II intron reverse transcriptase/maturase